MIVVYLVVVGARVVVELSSPAIMLAVPKGVVCAVCVLGCDDMM